jgi:protein phosphatase PTC1
MEGKGEDELEAQTSLDITTPSSRSSMVGGNGVLGGTAINFNGSLGRKSSGRRIRDFVGRLTGSDKKEDEDIEDISPEPKVDAIEPKSEKGLRRVLYTANVGDARAVLW